MKLVKIQSNKVSIKSTDADLDNITINDLLKLDDGEQNLIVTVTALTDNDTSTPSYENDYLGETSSLKTIECDIIGCLIDEKFNNSIDKYPTSDVTISVVTKDEFELMLSSFRQGFQIGEYTAYDIPAFVNGNKFFQRHACIVGNTGAGKSETLAKILEETSYLNNSNIVVFDIHGEYKDIPYVKTFSIGTTHSFPYWFFSLQDIMSNILKIKEETAVTIPSAIRKAFAETTGNADTLSPTKFDWDKIIGYLTHWNDYVEVTGHTKEGMPKTKQGDLYGKLTSAIHSMRDKQNDTRYSFMFDQNVPASYMQNLLNQILDNTNHNIKVIDLSEIPHEMLIPIIGTFTKLIYALHQDKNGTTPMTLVADEAHVYIHNNFNLSASERRTVEIFEIIAKEGRKFGFTLVVASQRPSELNKTIIAQCGNFIIGKLNNENDKSMMKGMLPEGISGIIESVTMFNAGDVLILGDSVPIALKIRVTRADKLNRPDSKTIMYWDLWR